MPHSYGASFSGVGRLGPTSLPRPILNTANPTPSPIIIRIGSQGGMLLITEGRRPRLTRYVRSHGACELFLNRSTSDAITIVSYANRVVQPVSAGQNGHCRLQRRAGRGTPRARVHDRSVPSRVRARFPVDAPAAAV